MISILHCVCLLAVGPLLVTHGIVVTLPGLGPIDGTTTRSYDLHRTIYQYLGIPFAKPPVGDLRFKRPQKLDTPWILQRNFSRFGVSCPQNDHPVVALQEEQSEDCLTVNVYTTKIKDGGRGTGQAVMVYIHGGTFMYGSAHIYEPHYLLDEDIVLVVPQYRLGPLGFLSLKTDQIPGNMGMLDMVLALEWVRDNIHVFGGDPTRVTIFGNSAGAAAVTLLLFSPRVEEGLFQRVIAQSGSAVCGWVLDADPVRHARQIAALVDCHDADDDRLAQCLRSRPYQDLLDAHNSLLSGSGDFEGGNHVVVEEDGPNSFLLEDPATLLQQGRFKFLPMMAGVTKHEGSQFIINACNTFLRLIQEDGDEAREYMEYDVIREALASTGVKDGTGFLETVLQDKYFESSDVGDLDAVIPGLIDIVGAADMKAPTFTMAKSMSLYKNAYFYSFNFFGRHSVFSDVSEYLIGQYSFAGGVAHSDELYYLFPQGKVLNEPEQAMAKRMVQLWTSFAKNGVPMADNFPIWPPISNYKGPYLRIDKDPKVLASFVKEEYTIAVKEGLTDPSSAISIQGSVLMTALMLALCGLREM